MALNKEIAQILTDIDLEDLLDRMEAYARRRLRGLSEKDLEGLEILDFVFTVFNKALTNVRNRGDSSFEQFVFGSLKSDISSFFKQKKNFVDFSENGDDKETSLDLEFIKKETIIELKRLGADIYELTLFECWTEGITKRAEIAELMEVSVKEIDYATKRLERKLLRLRHKIKFLL